MKFDKAVPRPLGSKSYQMILQRSDKSISPRYRLNKPATTGSRIEVVRFGLVMIEELSCYSLKWFKSAVPLIQLFKYALF